MENNTKMHWECSNHNGGISDRDICPCGSNHTEETKLESWEKEFDKRFTESSIDFRYKGDRDVMKYEISKIISLQRQKDREKVLSLIKKMEKKKPKRINFISSNGSTKLDTSFNFDPTPKYEPQNPYNQCLADLEQAIIQIMK